MNTVNVDKLVKTVKAQKEVFLCSPGPPQVDLVAVTTFTEIIEKPSKEGFGKAQKGFEVAVCQLEVRPRDVDVRCSIDPAPRPLQ